MSRAPPSACWPAASPPPSGWARRSSRRRATTALGALLGHITGGHIETIDEGPRSFQPMNINYGLFPPLEHAPKSEDGKRLRGPAKAVARKKALTDRARADLVVWMSGGKLPVAAE